MKNPDLLEMLVKSDAYADGVTVLAEGSIERAVEMHAASNPRWAGCKFSQLPRPQQLEVLDLAAMVEV
jgi:hypothetical protein